MNYFRVGQLALHRSTADVYDPNPERLRLFGSCQRLPGVGHVSKTSPCSASLHTSLGCQDIMRSASTSVLLKGVPEEQQLSSIALREGRSNIIQGSCFPSAWPKIRKTQKSSSRPSKVFPFTVKPMNKCRSDVKRLARPHWVGSHLFGYLLGS